MQQLQNSGLLQARNIRLAMVLTGLAAFVVAAVSVKTGVVADMHGIDSLASLQARFGLSYWTAYAVSWAVVAALTAGVSGFYAALIASGVGTALALALTAVYWYLRSLTRKQIQSY